MEKKIKSWGREKEKMREGKGRFSWCSDNWSSVILELKLVHAKRATRG